MALMYHELKTVCLSSVSKHTHSHISHSFRIYMFSNNVNLKSITEIIENHSEF